MKSFTIGELLIYNPTLKSHKKKPIESDMQQAKIMAYFPCDADIQQKCNSVGMAEGVYEFCHSLLGETQQASLSTGQMLLGIQKKAVRKMQIIVMNVCCLVLKEVEQNVWIFLKLEHEQEKQYIPYGNDEENGIINNTFTEQLCEQIIDHVYLSFTIFYGKITKYLFKQQLGQLQKIINYFVPAYTNVFRYENQLNQISYLLKEIRIIPLDVNSALKFMYFKNVIQSYDASILELMVFSNGYLAYSSLEKEVTQYFGKYLFGAGQPYRFQEGKIKNRFRMMQQMPKFSTEQRFGVLYNSRVLGFDQMNSRQSVNLGRSSLSIRPLKESSQQGQVDLLGLSEQQSKNELFAIHLNRNGEEFIYYINFYIQKSMVFITFYSQKYSFNQLIFQNRFYHDNADKFTDKISKSITDYVNKTDSYKFIFHNCSTFAGKSTLKEWDVLASQIYFPLSLTKANLQGICATTFQNYWVYAIRRFSRLLLLLIPSEVPLYKIDEFVGKMTKQYFLKAFM